MTFIMATIKNEQTSQHFQQSNTQNIPANEGKPLITCSFFSYNSTIKKSIPNDVLSPSSKDDDEEKQQQMIPVHNNEDENDKNNNYDKNHPIQVGFIQKQPLNTIIWDEAIHMMRLAIPVIGTYFLEILPGVVSIVLVGHIPNSENLKEECVDATALAVMLFNLMGLSFGFGLATAMDTLCSQACGANELYRIGTYFQSGLIVLSVTFCIAIFPLWNTADVLVALGQPVVVSKMAGTFAQHLIPGLPFLYLYELIRKVLQAQSITLPMLYASILANIMNIAVGYYLVYHTSHGWLGAAIARTSSSICFFLSILTYLFLSNLHFTFWTGWHIKEAFKGCYSFISLGIPGMFQLCFEWWAVEMLSVLCGILPNADVAIGSNAVLLNIVSVAYMLYWGVAIAGNVRIGNALGAGSILRARLAAYLTIGLEFINAMICGMVLLIFSATLPKLFTNDQAIDTYTTNLLYISAVFQVFDANNAAVQGIFRACGRQVVGAQLNFVAYFIIGIPLGALLAFKYELNVMGLWIGVTMGLLVIAVSGNILILKSDWHGLADDARRRMKQ